MLAAFRADFEVQPIPPREPTEPVGGALGDPAFARRLEFK